MEADMPSCPTDIRFLGTEAIVIVPGATFQLVGQTRRLLERWWGWGDVFHVYLVLYE